MQNGLAKRILDGDVGGGDRVQVDYRDDEFVFEKTYSEVEDIPAV